MYLIDLNVRCRQALASLLAIESQHLVPHLVGASVAQALLLEKAASIFTVHGIALRTPGTFDAAPSPCSESNATP